MSNTSDSAISDNATPLAKLMTAEPDMMDCSIATAATSTPPHNTASRMVGTRNRSRVRVTMAPRKRSCGSNNNAPNNSSAGMAFRKLRSTSQR
ncbi:unannotated protein [freshwater metagenome]|uniref:Unannotated protein n=1 Tax=freshwater metagenome TaxID=449393 RepID=A0A6J6PF23_9ZZZZ